MAVKNKGMGKGLDALLGKDFSLEPVTSASTLPISQVESCSSQPRKYFDPEKLEELVPTVREINREWTDYLLDGLSEEEVAQFEATLLKIARRAKEYVNSKDVIDL